MFRGAGLNQLRDKLEETKYLNKQFEELSNELGISIEEFSEYFRGLQTEIAEIRTNYIRSIKENIRFIEDFGKYQKEAERSSGKIGEVAESLRSENQRAIDIIRKYTNKE